jgi:hypothetical protein
VIGQSGRGCGRGGVWHTWPFLVRELRQKRAGREAWPQKEKAPRGRSLFLSTLLYV